MSILSPLASALTSPASLNTSLFGSADTSRPDPNATAPTFGQTLQNAFEQVNTLQNKASDMSVAFAKGQTSDIHNVMIAAQEATVALQMTTQIRNKAVEAYQEIMRISM